MDEDRLKVLSSERRYSFQNCRPGPEWSSALIGMTEGAGGRIASPFTACMSLPAGCLPSALDFHLDRVDFAAAHVFDGVRRDRGVPHGSIQQGAFRGLSGIERHLAQMIATNHVAPRMNGEHAWPAMGVYRYRLTRQ